MRYMVDLAVFGVVFILAAVIFKSAFLALSAAIIVAGAAEALLGKQAKGRG